MSLFKCRCGVGGAKSTSRGAGAPCRAACPESNARGVVQRRASRMPVRKVPCHPARPPKQCCMRRSRPSAFAGKAESSSRTSPSREAVPLRLVVGSRGKAEQPQLETQQDRLAFAGYAESSCRASLPRQAVPLRLVPRSRGEEDQGQHEAQRNRLQARLLLTTIEVMGRKPLIFLQASWSSIRPTAWWSRPNHSFEPTRSGIGPRQGLRLLSYRGPMPPRAAQLQR